MDTTYMVRGYLYSMDTPDWSVRDVHSPVPYLSFRRRKKIELIRLAKQVNHLPEP